MSNRRKPNKYRDGNQLCLFVEPMRTNSPLFTLFDEQKEIERLIGSDEDWLDKTLSAVLALWDHLYDTYVAKFDEEINEARKAKIKSADLELLRLKQALRLSLITNPFVLRMECYQLQVANKAKELGVSDEDIEYVNDLTHSFFHQPQSDELTKTLRDAIPILASELID